MTVDAGVKVKQEMLIGELSHVAGASERSLRHYESKGLLSPERTSSGYRRYSPDAVRQVQRIRGLLDAGFNLDTIALIVPCVADEDQSVHLCPTIESVMRKALTRIDADLDALNHRRASVSRLLG